MLVSLRLKFDFRVLSTASWIATAATNGAVVLWDLNKPSKSKQGKGIITVGRLTDRQLMGRCTN